MYAQGKPMCHTMDKKLLLLIKWLVIKGLSVCLAVVGWLHVFSPDKISRGNGVFISYFVVVVSFFIIPWLLFPLDVN